MISDDDKLKSRIIKVIFMIFCFNIAVILLYCYFFLNANLNRIVDSDRQKLNSIFTSISNSIVSIKDIPSFEEKYNVKIIVRDMNFNILYGEDVSKYSYSLADIISINDTDYLFYIYKLNNFSISIFITFLLFLEIGTTLIIIIISYKVASKRFLEPITNLRHDMNDYRNGKIPNKREPDTSVDELQNQFVDLTEALELEKQKKNEIIASISHDIKTPLTSIMGYASRLENANLTEEVKSKYIGKIILKSYDIKDIIDEFDDYLCTSFKGNLNFEEITIKDLVSMLINSYEEELKEKGISLKISNRSKKEIILIDIAKLRRVFSNIISNSIRYINTKNNSKGVINIYIVTKNSFVEFEVADNGTGVDNDNISKIFDPLYTTDASRKISGLGLSICRQIIEAHGGTIWARNNKLGGLSIHFKVKSVK